MPPFAGDFLATSYCPADCLSAGLDNQDIHIFANTLHSHLLGSKIRTRLIRNGTELPPIAEDNNYDFNFQEVRKLPQERTLTKGDSMVLECVYSSKYRNHTTLGGLSTQHEMCLAFILYYPRVSLTNCQTTPMYDIPNYNISNPPAAKAWLKDNFDWSKSSDIQRFQEMTNTVDVKTRCWGNRKFKSDGKMNHQVDLQPSKKYIPPKVCK